MSVSGLSSHSLTALARLTKATTPPLKAPAVKSVARAAAVVVSISPVASATAAAALNPLVAQSSGTTTPSITMTKGYPAYEFAGSVTQSIAGTSTNSATQTVGLSAGSSYTVSASFGLSDKRGQMKLDVLDAAGNVVKTITAAAGKTSASITFTPTTSGTYSIRLTGLAIPKASSTTNLYSSYSINVGQPLSTLPKTSGDTNVDTLLQGATNSWQHALGTSATSSSNVIHAGLNSLNNVLGGTIYYDFMDANYIASNLTGVDANQATAMTAAQNAAVTKAFQYISSIANLTFAPTTDATKATIMFGDNVQASSAGYANPPNQSGSHQQYMFLASNATTNNSFASGTYGWETVIHEIGHTLGFKHPFNGNAGGGGAPAPYLPTATNNHRYTVMSYTNPTDSNILAATYSNNQVKLTTTTTVNPSTYMTYDIEALQYLYGANTAPTGDAASTLASVQKLTFDDTFNGMETIWAPTGQTLDASATTRSDTIDMRGGAYSTIDYQSGADQITKQLAAQNMTPNNIASVLKSFKTTIATAYTGANSVGLAYGSQLSTVETGSANDTIYAANYSAKIDGGGGNNTVYLEGASKDWKVTNGTSAGEMIYTNGKITETLDNIKTVAFYNPATTALTH